MLAFLLSLTIGITALESLPEPAGTIQGVVVNGTHGNQPLEDVEVVLRAGADGELVPVAETKTDRYGKFVFEQVPLEPTLVYLPGANRDGVHYPGQRVRLDPSDRIAQVTIVVFDAVSTPCPLVAKRHDIDVTVDEQVLKITESLLISNPSRATYVGQSMGNGPPVTFWLSIPKNFDRVTFDKEFFGRRFFVVDHRPITEMPWLPGEQELRFTYRVPVGRERGPIPPDCWMFRVLMFASACMERTSGLCRAICLGRTRRTANWRLPRRASSSHAISRSSCKSHRCRFPGCNTRGGAPSSCSPCWRGQPLRSLISADDCQIHDSGTVGSNSRNGNARPEQTVLLLSLDGADEFVNLVRVSGNRFFRSGRLDEMELAFHRNDRGDHTIAGPLHCRRERSALVVEIAGQVDQRHLQAGDVDFFLRRLLGLWRRTGPSSGRCWLPPCRPPC